MGNGLARCLRFANDMRESLGKLLFFVAGLVTLSLMAAAVFGLPLLLASCLT